MSGVNDLQTHFQGDFCDTIKTAIQWADREGPPAGTSDSPHQVREIKPGGAVLAKHGRAVFKATFRHRRLKFLFTNFSESTGTGAAVSVCLCRRMVCTSLSDPKCCPRPCPIPGSTPWYDPQRFEALMERLILVVIAVVVFLIYRVLRGSNQRTGAPQDAAYHGESYPFSEIDPDPNFPIVNSFCTKIRGVTKTNPDGADRQSIIRKWCRSGDALYLVREPNNPVDSNAIQVRRIVRADLPDRKYKLGEQLGYISREVALELSTDMDANGFVVMAKILDVTGAEYGRFGVNIEVEEYRPVLSKATSQPKA